MPLRPEHGAWFLGMRIERKSDGDVTLLAFTGEFDASNLPTISEKLDNLIETGVKKLVLNLRLLKFINSSALGYLIKTRKRLAELDGDLVIAQPSKFFQSTITTLGIDQIFKIFPVNEEAIKYFHDAGGDDGTLGVPARLHPRQPSGSGAAPLPEQNEPGTAE